MADDDKIYMLNALWFKPENGAAKYQEYLKAAVPNVVNPNVSNAFERAGLISLKVSVLWILV
jgi:hypothetical protein